MLENAALAKLLVDQDIPAALANVLTKAIDEDDEDLAEKVSKMKPFSVDARVFWLL